TRPAAPQTRIGLSIDIRATPQQCLNKNLTSALRTSLLSQIILDWLGTMSLSALYQRTDQWQEADKIKIQHVFALTGIPVCRWHSYINQPLSSVMRSCICRGCIRNPPGMSNSRSALQSAIMNEKGDGISIHCPN